MENAPTVSLSYGVAYCHCIWLTEPGCSLPGTTQHLAAQEQGPSRLQAQRDNQEDSVGQCERSEITVEVHVIAVILGLRLVAHRAYLCTAAENCNIALMQL